MSPQRKVLIDLPAVFLLYLCAFKWASKEFSINKIKYCYLKCNCDAQPSKQGRIDLN